MTDKIRIIPLGGIGEIGKNMTVIEQGNDAIIIDVGIMFPENDMHGVDYIIPDYNYLVNRKDIKIHGILFTHGHEDHIGAVQHAVSSFPEVPLYASKLTAGLIAVKLNDGRSYFAGAIHHEPEIRVIKAGENFRVGPFKVEPFHMAHSIPDCLGFAINTPFGLIVHTGDYKFDHTPVDGRMPDYARLASFGQRGVKLLLADSTNADKEGWTPSETIIDAAFDRVFKEAKGRIMVATFASLISRIQQVANAAKRHNRKLTIHGHTMREYVKLARQYNYLDIPDAMLVDINRANSVEPNRLVLMVTGAQGEPSAVLGKLSTGKHRYLDVEKGDTIILSSHPIPGNEESVYRTIDRLIERGAHVVYDPVEKVHVSGHARRDEMRLLLSLVRPEYLMPVHGEVRHLVHHKELAISCGIPEAKVIIPENGSVIEVDRTVRKTERVPGGYVFVDGSGVGDVGKSVIRDRETLARDGFLVISINLDKKNGQLLSEPEIISRGFTYLKEADELMDSVRYTIFDTLQNHRTGNRREVIEETVGRLLYNETRRRPMVFTIINEF